MELVEGIVTVVMIYPMYHSTHGFIFNLWEILMNLYVEIPGFGYHCLCLL